MKCFFIDKLCRMQFYSVFVMFVVEKAEEG